jgi:hypothetical protein
MKRGFGHFAFLVLTGVLALPIVNSASPARQQERRGDQKHDGANENVNGVTGERVYDRAHKDYHFWNENEEKIYRQYLSDRHMDYRALSKQSHNKQRAYWNWRHNQAPYLE